jgi:hypothetical protein
MSDMFFLGSQEDCQFIADTLDYAMDMPVPGHDGNTGAPICTPEEAAAKKALWRSMSKEQQNASMLTSIWIGWSVRWMDVWAESPPGTRFGIWIPGNMATVISEAASKSIFLSLAQTSALLAAAAAAQPATPPDWVEPP